MVLRLLILICALLPAFPAGAQVSIQALTPASASPGERVTLAGGPFPPDSRVELGESTLAPERAEPGKLVFVVPEIPEGDYLPVVRSGDRSWPSPFALRILEPRPRIEAVSPSLLDRCSEPGERRVTISGEGFLPGAALLVDGAGTPVDQRSRERLVFTAPSLQPGRHQLQVVNPGGLASLPFGLTVDNTPEILSVTQGADRVSSYELILEGKNFLAASTLLVDGRPILDSPTRPVRSDRVEYVDCRTLIYHRHPYSGELKRISLRVVNPGGEQSPVHHVTVP